MIRWKAGHPAMSSAHTASCSLRIRKPHAGRLACRRFNVRAQSSENGRDTVGKPLVVVGSVNADMVLQVDRLPEAGETLAAEDLETFPGGKVHTPSLQPLHCILMSENDNSVVCVGYWSNNKESIYMLVFFPGMESFHSAWHCLAPARIVSDLHDFKTTT